MLSDCVLNPLKSSAIYKFAGCIFKVTLVCTMYIVTSKFYSGKDYAWLDCRTPMDAEWVGYHHPMRWLPGWVDSQLIYTDQWDHLGSNQKSPYWRRSESSVPVKTSVFQWGFYTNPPFFHDETELQKENKKLGAASHKVSTIWFSTFWDDAREQWRIEQCEDMIHSLTLCYYFVLATPMACMFGRVGPGQCKYRNDFYYIL